MDAETVLTIREIHVALGRTPCDLVSVYRNLNTLNRAGLVQRFFRHDGTVLFKLVSPEAEEQLCVFNRLTGQTTCEQSGLVKDLNDAITAVEACLRAQGYTAVVSVAQFFVADKPVGQPRRKGIRVAKPRDLSASLARLRSELESAAPFYSNDREEFRAKVAKVFTAPGSLASRYALGDIHIWGYLIKDRAIRNRQYQLVGNIRRAFASIAPVDLPQEE